MLRELAAKILEHADGAVPLLEVQQLGGGVVTAHWRRIFDFRRTQIQPGGGL